MKGGGGGGRVTPLPPLLRGVHLETISALLAATFAPEDTFYVGLGSIAVTLLSTGKSVAFNRWFYWTTLPFWITLFSKTVNINGLSQYIVP